MIKALVHILVVVFLTLLTQVGGLVWLLNFAFFSWLKKDVSRRNRVMSFVAAYLLVSVFLVPPIAKQLGRVPLPISKKGELIPYNYLLPIMNRHYVVPKLRDHLIEISKRINKETKVLKVSYLDANFPFIDGFPLLPHLSHKDGKKVDLSFYYMKNKQMGNYRPSLIGYGQFVEPTAAEYNQTQRCIDQGYWQYDYTKYFNIVLDDELEFDGVNTKDLINQLLSSSASDKLLLEPHLKNRMKLKDRRIRFQGCYSVRHDDHIHYQIK